MKQVPTYTVQLYIGGNIEEAKRQLNMICYLEGLCVTIEPTTFIYTGGTEQGMVIGFVNYPRFPKTPETIWNLAVEIAHILIPALNQKTALLVAMDRTAWIPIDPPGC